MGFLVKLMGMQTKTEVEREDHIDKKMAQIDRIRAENERRFNAANQGLRQAIIKMTEMEDG